MRSLLYGIGVFIAATAALTFAFAIAITGPPRISELEEFVAFLGEVSKERAATTSETNDQPTVQPAPEPEQAIIIEAPPPGLEEAEFAEAEAETVPPVGADETTLLGDPLRRDPARAEPARTQAERPAQARRVQAERPRARTERRQVTERAAPERRTARAPVRERAPANTRRPPPPVAVARVESMAPLPDTPGARALDDLREARAPEIVPDEPTELDYEPEPEADEGMQPTQHEAAPVREDEASSPDEKPAEEEAYEEAYNNAPDRSWYRSEAYERELEWRREQEARRRYREERRAYREWRRRSGW